MNTDFLQERTMLCLKMELKYFAPQKCYWLLLSLTSNECAHTALVHFFSLFVAYRYHFIVSYQVHIFKSSFAHLKKGTGGVTHVTRPYCLATRPALEKHGNTHGSLNKTRLLLMCINVIMVKSVSVLLLRPETF